MTSKLFKVIGTGDDAWEAMDHPELADKLRRRPLFLRIEAPEGVDPVRHAKDLIVKKDTRIRDPDGPCGVIRTGLRSWLFFGWYRVDADPLPEPPERISLSELVALEDDEDDAHAGASEPTDVPEPEDGDPPGE